MCIYVGCVCAYEYAMLCISKRRQQSAVFAIPELRLIIASCPVLIYFFLAPKLRLSC